MPRERGAICSELKIFWTRPSLAKKWQIEQLRMVPTFTSSLGADVNSEVCLLPAYITLSSQGRWRWMHLENMDVSCLINKHQWLPSIGLSQSNCIRHSLAMLNWGSKVSKICSVFVSTESCLVLQNILASSASHRE